MKKAKQFPNAIKKYFHPENKSCYYCQGKTKADHLVSRRYVVRFDEVIHAHNMGRRCIDDACHEAHGRTYFHSAQADALSIKRFTYGMDILTLLGEVLHAEIVSSSDTETMVRLLQVIQDQAIPLLGIVSDAQRSIRKAVSLVFPEIPYQL